MAALEGAGVDWAAVKEAAKLAFRRKKLLSSTSTVCKLQAVFGFSESYYSIEAIAVEYTSLKLEERGAP